MISPKAKMRVRLAVKDYQEMYPQEYKDLLIVIQQQKDNLKNDMAEIKGHSLKRALYTISENLNEMIGKKLEQSDKLEWKEKDSQRWFCKEFPQFMISKFI
jgi:hypothetical protein